MNKGIAVLLKSFGIEVDIPKVQAIVDELVAKGPQLIKWAVATIQKTDERIAAIEARLEALERQSAETHRMLSDVLSVIQSFQAGNSRSN